MLFLVEYTRSERKLSMQEFEHVSLILFSAPPTNSVIQYQPYRICSCNERPLKTNFFTLKNIEEIFLLAGIAKS